MEPKLRERNKGSFLTVVHYGIQAIDSGFRKGQWVFGTVEVPCAEELKSEENPSPPSSLPKEEGFENVCEDGATHIARLLEKQGYITTTWAGGIVSYLPGEPKTFESTPSILVTGKYLYPVFDATGTVRMWADGAGNIIARSAPGPYGEELGYFPGPRTSMLGFAGYLGDKGGSGLWHTPNRSLTNQGRFLSVDPSGTLNLHDPRTFNQYAYVIGNPVSYTDPLGLSVYVATYAEDSSAQWQFGEAAETWAGEISQSKGFDSGKDYVIISQLKEFDDLVNTFEFAKNLEPEYGKVAAWAHFQHGGEKQGPYFGVSDPKDRNQASMEKLMTVGFNFEKQAIVAFYSCKSAQFAEQFAKTFGVTTFGFQGGIYPSLSRSFRGDLFMYFSQPINMGFDVYFLQAQGMETTNSFWKGLLFNMGYPGAMTGPMRQYGPEH